MNGWVVFLLLLAAYLGVYFALRKRPGPLPGGFEFNGPFLFWRTQFGKQAIQQVAKPKRFWNAVADVGIVLTWLTGLAVFALLVLSLAQYFTQPETVAETAPPPEFLIGLPGVNPLIPVGYGILALIFALVIHEGSHGVMAYVGRMRVKSLGLVVFIVPVGAFVEPHEEDIARASARQKNRVFAAGPTSNLVLALVAGLVLSSAFMSNVAIANDGQGVVVGSVEVGSAAEAAGLQPGDLITGFQGIRLYDANATENDTATAPAPQDVAIVNRTQYSDVLAATRAGDNLTVLYLRDGAPLVGSATLGDRYDYLARVAPEQNDESNRGKGFLGVSGIGLDGLDGVRQAMVDPFEDVPTFFFYISYPFFIFSQGIDIMAPPYSDLFVVDGPLASLPAPVFFGLATLLYWIVWLNLMLGTFNALPAGPLDGGQMLRATLRERLMRRYRVDPQQVEVERLEVGGFQEKGKDPETQAKLDRVNSMVSRTTRGLGFFILGLILLPLFGPPLLKLFL